MMFTGMIERIEYGTLAEDHRIKSLIKIPPLDYFIQHNNKKAINVYNSTIFLDLIV